MPVRKRLAILGISGVAGLGFGLLFHWTLKACAGICPISRNPWPLALMLSATALWAAWNATKDD